MKNLLTIVLLFTISYSFACKEDGSEGFMPENDLNIPTTFKNLHGMDEMVFNNVIDKIEKHYSKVVHDLGGALYINRYWANGTVNALAMRRGRIWYVNMYGGLARHPEVTPDAFALVVCHELGHHIGGAPTKGPGYLTSEGQADYWGSLKCLRQIWKYDDNAAALENKVIPPIVENKCSQQYSNSQDKNLCIRSTMAGLSLSTMLAQISYDRAPDINIQSLKRVFTTYVQHPRAQCRLDTFFSGALCTKNENTPVSNYDEQQGTCENDLNLEQTQQPVGSRPLCWYAPKQSYNNYYSYND